MEVNYDLGTLNCEKLHKAAVDYLTGIDFDKDTSEMIASTGVENLKENIEGLLKNLNSGNFQKAADAAHAIKGILWNMGLQEEGMLFKEVQLAVLDNDPEEKVVSCLKKAFESISK